MIALDLDGTLLNSESKLSDFTIDTIKKISALGHKVIITTGRPYRMAHTYYKQLELDTPMINFNGSLTHLPEKKWADEQCLTLDKKYLLDMVANRDTIQADFIAGEYRNKFFITDVVNGNVVGDYWIWITSENEHGEDTSKWIKCDPTNTYYKQVVKELECFCHSYQNARTSVLLNNDKLAEYNIQFDEFSDRLDIYAFKYTAFAGQPLIIKNIYLDGGQNKFTTDNRRFKIPDKFEPNYGLLSVYIDGIRQYYVNENQDGLGFSLPSPVKAPAMVTYVIETLDAPSESYCKRIILDEKHIVPNTINVYKTYRTDVPDTNPDDRISLYPGRVSVYIDGVRQPQSSFTIVDNYTISFNSSLTKVVGGKDTFPYEVIRNELGEAMYHVDGSLRIMEHSETDKILIEVKQDLDKVESYIEVPPTNDGFSIDVAANQLDPAILETNDEILIYLDGLFLGLRDNDSSTFTYTKDVYRGKITINSPYHIEEIISDPLNDYLNANPQAAEAYKKNNGGKPYTPKPKKIILEWRNE